MTRFLNGRMAPMWLALCVMIGALGGCRPIWRNRWWDFYERGLARVSERQNQEAAEDFETAVGMRGGATFKRDKDARRVRKYGTHMIDDYYPHRELGVAYFNIGLKKKPEEQLAFFKKAEKQLRISLCQTRSAKAKAYLNLVRAEILKETPAQDQPPVLELKNLQDGQYLNSDKTTLEGKALSKNYVSNIFVNGERLFIELAETEKKFSKELKLKPGENKVLVKAEDLVGKSKERELVVNVDIQYPAVGIKGGIRRDPNTVAVSGVVTDNSGVEKLEVRGHPQPIERGSKKVEFSLDAAEGDTVPVEVADIAGNKTSARIRITEGTPEFAGGTRSRPVQLAMLGSDRLTDSGQFGDLLSEGTADRSHPIIEALGEVDGLVVYDEKFAFDIVIRSRVGLKTVSVNRGKIDTQDAPEETKIRLGTLDEGVNRFTVVAVDTEDNETEKTFKVTRKIPEPLQLAARLTVALLPLRTDPDVQPETRTIYRLLRDNFTERKRFNFVPESDLRGIISERGIADSELAEKNTALDVGRRIEAAEGVFFGRIMEDRRSITVELRFLDTETKGILSEPDDEDIYVMKKRSRDEISWRVDGLVEKLTKRFPVVRGRVTRVRGNEVIIDKGSAEGIWPGAKYLILKEDEQMGPGALTIRRVDGQVVEAQVMKWKQVLPQSSLAKWRPFSREVSPALLHAPIITK